jgi:ATP-dependent helicase Lhr and Lhr-like helicase
VEARDCVIVATSTLELGIDIGDLDRVIQVDSPLSVASFLQRLGRTGRRRGTTRNCLFLATSENALLTAGALLSLWESGFVEPVSPPARPLHLFAQQLMALALQEGGIGVRDWRNWLNRLPCFAQEGDEVLDEVIRHLLDSAILYSDGIRLSFGEAGEDLYGRRHFLELVSVFTSDPVFKVMHGQKDLGSVDQITFLRHHGDEPLVLSMGGRSWSVVSLDWARRQAFVIPAASRGKSQWQGGRLGMPWRFARAVHSLLTSASESNRWTTRARTALAALRVEYDFLRSGAEVVLADREKGEVRWFTFAGGSVNTALADAMDIGGMKEASITDFGIRVVGLANAERIIEVVSPMNASAIRDAFRVSDDYLEKLKFSECLPADRAREIVRERMLRVEEIDATIGRDVVIVRV